MTVGENIRRIRKEKGLTQKKLGELCGINESQIRRYELGLNNSNPKLETIQKIARALGVEYIDLFSFEKHQITTELLSSRPDVKKCIIENVIMVMGNGIDNRVKEILTTGTDEEIVKILNAIITDIEINKELDTININFFVTSQNDKLLKAFEKLNGSGKEKAIEHVEMLTKIPEYRKDEE